MFNNSGSGSGNSMDSPPLQKASPKSKKDKYTKGYNALIKIKTSGSRFVLSKLHPHYYMYNNSLLLEYLSDQELKEFMQDINDTIKKNWPPQKLITMAYMMIPFSCGISLLCPYCCFENAEKYFQWKLDEYNIKWEKRGLKVGWEDEELVFLLFGRRGKEEDDFGDIDVIVG